MNVNAYCERKLRADDLAQYFTLLFLPASQRRAAMALYALWQELREIHYECADAALARVKLAWWHDELHEMYRGRARHPAAQAMTSVIEQHALPEDEFLALLAALAQHIDTDAYPTHAALQEHGKRTRGRVDALAAAIVSAPSAVSSRVTDLGGTLELVALLRDSGIDARRGRVYLPHAELARFGINISDLRAGRCEAAARALVQHQSDQLHEELTQHIVGRSADADALPPQSRVAASMGRTLLARIRAHPERVWHERLRLAPLRLLWIAWHGARRARRSALP
jgi:15-cis-phytoene synthase